MALFSSITLLSTLFLELVYTDSYLNNLINFGIEGIHYKKVSSNVIKETSQTSRYCPGTGWMFGNEYLNYVWQGEDANKRAAFRKFEESAVRSKIFGFVFNEEPVAEEIKQCQQIWNNYIPLLESGEADPDSVLKEMNERLKEAGVDKIIAEKQAQLDAWLK